MKQFTRQAKSTFSNQQLTVTPDQLIADKRKTLQNASSKSWDSKFRLWTAHAAAVAMIALLVAFGIENANAQFKSGTDVAVFVAAASASNTTGSIVEINTTAANQSGTSQAIPSILRFSGSAGTTMYLANSNDGTLVCFAGADTTSSGGNVNAVQHRSAGTFNSLGSFNLATTYINPSLTGGVQTRGATSLDNSTWYIADQNGMYTNSATLASPLPVIFYAQRLLVALFIWVLHLQ